MPQKSLVIADERDLVRKQAVADYLGVTTRTVETWTKLRKIPCIRIGGKWIRYRLADISQTLGENYCVEASNLDPWKKRRPRLT
jgi:excisionase family DNA binding protein